MNKCSVGLDHFKWSKLSNYEFGEMMKFLESLNSVIEPHKDKEKYYLTVIFYGPDASANAIEFKLRFGV